MEIDKTGFARGFKFFVLCIYLVVFSNGTKAQSSIGIATGLQVEEVSRKEVLDHVRRLRSALLERDSVALLRLLADDVKYGHSNGLTQNKEEVIRSVLNGQHDYRSPWLYVMRIYGYKAPQLLLTCLQLFPWFCKATRFQWT